MTELRDVLVIGIVLVAALAVSACLEIATDLKEWAPVVATSADETAANATDADNRMDEVPVRNLSVTALSNTSADENDPVWSPDGRRIFFKSDDRICVCDPDGSHREELAEIEWNSLVMDPEQKRAFYKNRTCTVDGSEETYQAYVMGIDGKNLTKIASLTLEDEYVDDGGYIGGTRMLAYDTHSWSPDGKRMVYASGKPVSMGVGETREIDIWMMNEDGSEERLLTTITTGFIVRMVWSPDGSKIAVVTWELVEDGIDRDIYMIDMPATEEAKNENHT